MIGAVLLIATGIYAFYLYQQVNEWRSAANQLSIGQDLLRADRDEILQKAREQEAAVANLEAARAQDRARLNGLENQRSRLQDDVLRLTETLAQTQRQANGVAADASELAELDQLRRDHDRLERDLGVRDADIARLEADLANLKKDSEETEAAVDVLNAEKASLESTNIDLKQERDRISRQLVEQRESERLRQIVRGHRASLGEVRPYIAEVGPGDWSVIESWLALRLGRPMAVPDLAGHDWSYEGARLIGASDGPPMVMLLYADADERPVSLTIAPDRSGERPLESSENGGLNVLTWYEERHAFVLAGEAEDDTLKAVGVDLLNQPPSLSEDAAVPVSRYIRPGQRPNDAP